MLEKLGNLGALANIGRRSNTLLGVDISSTSIKILQLSPVGNKYRVDNYVIRPLPANANRRTELLIFITPKIIADINIR